MTDGAATVQLVPGGLERRTPEIVALGADAPSFSDLFLFMRDAELRVDSLKMRIVDRRMSTLGETEEVSEIWLRHPGRAKVVTRRAGPDEPGISRDFSVWLADGAQVRTYDASSSTATVRPARQPPVGLDDPDLPPRARVYRPLTDLPFETVADAFVHPHGFCLNVLTTARLRLLGTTVLAGDREAYLIRADHPRTTMVLTDRPDRRVEVGVDRASGFMLGLTELIGDRVTRDAEVTDLELDAPFNDDVFRLHLSPDVRLIY